MEININNVKKEFELQTGVSQSEIVEISDAYPFSKIARILTMHETYFFMLSNFGKAKKNSFQTEIDYYRSLP